MTLKPVTYVGGPYQRHSQNTAQQILLLKALRVTQDPKKLRQMIGVKTVADVYRTLDKLAMRKEYHHALSRLGLSFDYLISNVKSVIDNAELDKDRLAGVNLILKSLGLDKYEEEGVSGGNWEDALLKLSGTGDEPVGAGDSEDYEVIAPEIPASVVAVKAQEKKEGQSLYD